MPKILIGISILLMTLSLVFGFLNTGKVKSLRSEINATNSAREMAERARLTTEKKFKAGEKAVGEAQSKISAAEEAAQKAEASLSKAQTDKAELDAKLQASEGQIADLQKRVADVTASAGNNPAGAPGAPNDLKAQLEDAKQQLQAAEDEKKVLADKVQAAQDKAAALEEEKKRNQSGTNKPGVHGTVLAVNQAYNFVVLSIGERQGLAQNSELLVMRSGTLIGRVRISSVEPTTSIGDIINNSLPRGVEVQPGDTVVYAGLDHS